MQSATQAAHVTQIGPAPRTRLWAGRIISTLAVLFLLFDGITKVMKSAPVMAATVQLGVPKNLVPVVGIILLVCTVVYSIPRTSIFGAILLTGYLGGAVVIQMRVGNPLFETIFPVIFGVLVWGGLFLRDDRLRLLIPLRTWPAL
jgi:hypothetical protein